MSAPSKGAPAFPESRGLKRKVHEREDDLSPKDDGSGGHKKKRQELENDSQKDDGSAATKKREREANSQDDDDESGAARKRSRGSGSGDFVDPWAPCESITVRCPNMTGSILNNYLRSIYTKRTVHKGILPFFSEKGRRMLWRHDLNKKRDQNDTREKYCKDLSLPEPTPTDYRL